jgi:hypothetical protein
LVKTKWLSNRIKNDSRIFEHPEGSCSSDSERRFRKEKVVCTFCSTLLDSGAKGKIDSHLAKTLSRWPVQKYFCKKIIYGTGDLVFCLWLRNKVKEFWMGWWDIPFGRRNWNSKGPAWRPCWTFFFDSQGVVHTEFVPERKTVNAEFYNGIMDRLLKLIHRVLPTAVCYRDFFLLHDNAPAHKAASVCQLKKKKNVTTLYHTLYSPDLSPPDYFLFPNLKMKLKGLHLRMSLRSKKP